MCFDNKRNYITMYEKDMCIDDITPVVKLL